MPGIANMTVAQFQDKINGFRQIYVTHWNVWLQALQAQQNVASTFGQILRRWQACRPNKMRRTQQEAHHSRPFLEDLLLQSNHHIQALQNFDIRKQASLNSEAYHALEQLWNIFQHLCYGPNQKGIVIISKAVLMLTEGRVGPAFDSNLQRVFFKPLNARQWFDALERVSEDILLFELANHCSLQQATPHGFADLNSGRIYDMALGPRET
jgi:hypothetical protein